MQKMGLTQPTAAVKEKWIVRRPQRLAHCYTTRMRKTVARPYHKIVKRIIRMKLKFFLAPNARRFPLAMVNTKIHRNKMACHLLCRSCKAAPAVVSQKMNCRIVRATYNQCPTVHLHRRQFIKPLPAVNQVKNFSSLYYIGENVFHFPSCQTTLLYNFSNHKNVADGDNLTLAQLPPHKAPTEIY
jgi:hypothetical protein